MRRKIIDQGVQFISPIKIIDLFFSLALNFTRLSAMFLSIVHPSPDVGPAACIARIETTFFIYRDVSMKNEAQRKLKWIFINIREFVLAENSNTEGIGSRKSDPVRIFAH